MKIERAGMVEGIERDIKSDSDVVTIKIDNCYAIFQSLGDDIDIRKVKFCKITIEFEEEDS